MTQYLDLDHGLIELRNKVIGTFVSRQCALVELQRLQMHRGWSELQALRYLDIRSSISIIAAEREAIDRRMADYSGDDMSGHGAKVTTYEVDDVIDEWTLDGL